MWGKYTARLPDGTNLALRVLEIRMRAAVLVERGEEGRQLRAVWVGAGLLAAACLLTALPPRAPASDEVRPAAYLALAPALPALNEVQLVPTPLPTWVVERGVASWYGPRFHGRRTASGEIFDKEAWVMATRHLPLGSRARVRYGDRECLVRVTDRGPYIAGRIYDVSEGVARYLGFLEQGLAEVEVSVLRDPPPDDPD